jgi:hypothetical protein
MLGSLLDLILPRALFIREGRGVKQEVGARNVTGEKSCEVSLFCLSGLSGSSGVCGVLNQWSPSALADSAEVAPATKTGQRGRPVQAGESSYESTAEQ